VGLQVGNVGLEPLALVTPAEVHDGQLPGLSSGARPQAQAHRSITYFRFLSKDFLEGYRLWIAGQQGEVEQYRLDLRALGDWRTTIIICVLLRMLSRCIHSVIA
jgi:hypothetical protein